jgi:hypothetical protein
MNRIGPKDSLVVQKERDTKEAFHNIVAAYLASNPVLQTHGKISELEIRFSSNPKLSRPISKIDYDNVVKQLYSCGFIPDNENGYQILRINNEYIDEKTGITKMSNIRAEVAGADLIQEYCKTNDLKKVMDMPSTVFNKLKFTQKMTPKDNAGNLMRPVDNPDFNFRVSYQHEIEYNTGARIAKEIMSRWNDSKKTFRCLNRVRFSHPDIPIFADISIVKRSRTANGVPVPTYTIQEAGVFDNVEAYEIELEVDNRRVGLGTDFDLPHLLDAMKKMIRNVLSALQGSKYPISLTEKTQVLHEYMRLLHGKDAVIPHRITSHYFIGPSSYTLQIDNVVDPASATTNKAVPNIRSNYTVTDKADGERRLLFITETGKIYMIDTNMNVQFTGAVTGEKACFHSILDGEYIKTDKTGRFINLYAAFDIYYLNKKSVREMPFMTMDEESAPKFRVFHLRGFMDIVKAVSVLKKEGKPEKTDFRIECKTFYMNADKDSSIFAKCSDILSRADDGNFEYNMDGLIFTPANTGVGSNRAGVAGNLEKTTWTESFKWKPPEFNTIDFLVKVKQDKSGRDEIHSIFQEGKSLTGNQEVVQYKTLVLHCGFDEKKHGFLNPYQDVLDGKFGHSSAGLDREEGYRPVPFQPTDPYDEMACLCNVHLKKEGVNQFMFTEEEEYFEQDTIVEFKYVAENEPGWKWVPLRVRYDKTAELKAGLKNYGNAYHVANSNWHSIHHPITKAMIMSGADIIETAVNEDVYYARSTKESNTDGLRNFHNLYVKKMLIMGASSRGNTLIDYSVGKAGDLSKWIASKLSFVFGVDISRDNIHNTNNGACARYLNERKRQHDIPGALFVVGDSGLNIRSGQAFSSEKDKQVARAVFGTGPKDAGVLGHGVYSHYGVAQQGFNVSSCQFSLHYFFENERTLHSFLRNLGECTRLNGYFVGTCYDGQTVFNMLSGKAKEDGITIMSNGTKIFEMIKMYDETGFPDDELSLGYGINVYQETINQYIREFLVNFKYLVRMMENYGFVLVEKAEAAKMGLPDGTGMFLELYNAMENENKRTTGGGNNHSGKYGKASLMTPEEKRISFMNRYFVFKKVRNDVDYARLARFVTDHEKQDAEVTADITMEKDVANRIRKVPGKKVVLTAFTPYEEEGAKTEVSDEPVLVTTIPTYGEPMKLKIKKRK